MGTIHDHISPEENMKDDKLAHVRCSLSLDISEATTGQHYASIRMAKIKTVITSNVGENAEQVADLYAVSNIDTLDKKWQFFTTLRPSTVIHLSDPATPLLGFYHRKKETMFTHKPEHKYLQ